MEHQVPAIFDPQSSILNLQPSILLILDSQFIDDLLCVVFGFALY